MTQRILVLSEGIPLAEVQQSGIFSQDTVFLHSETLPTGVGDAPSVTIAPRNRHERRVAAALKRKEGA